MFLRSNFTPFLSKNVQIWNRFLPFLFPKDSEYLNSLDIGLQEVGAKRPLNKVNKWEEFFFTFLSWQFDTIFEQKGSNLRTLHSIIFPQGFWTSKEFGYWTSESGGKKAVKQSEQTLTDRQTHKTNKKWQNPS